METIRRTAILGALSILMCASAGAAAHSGTIDAALVGAWTPSIADCSRLFTRTGRGIAFKAACRQVRSGCNHPAGGSRGPVERVQRLQGHPCEEHNVSCAECRDAIGYLSDGRHIKVKSAREIVYSASGGEALNVTYLKCPM